MCVDEKLKFNDFQQNQLSESLIILILKGNGESIEFE